MFINFDFYSISFDLIIRVTRKSQNNVLESTDNKTRGSALS